MDLHDRVSALFEASIDTKRRAAAVLAEPIVRAGQLVVARLLVGGKVLSCGNRRFRGRRPALRLGDGEPLRSTSGPACRRSR